MLHELGHGLNLPHNKQKKSDASSGSRGTALMANGNYTYGKDPTFLTKASCAILNNNQVFNNVDTQFYTSSNATITELNAIYANGNIDISGAFTTDSPVNSINIYHDPASAKDSYDAVSWSIKVGANNTFNAIMPINELFETGDSQYVLRIGFNHASGNTTYTSYGYKFLNGIPVIDLGEKEYLNKSKWRVVSFN
ncbi:hypothetical protein [Mariniflexile sp.]|uniref:hypothetical protein n=1 Tax=Mariniflexile sp. TaxID=1979402 RepID=UPI004048CB96